MNPDQALIRRFLADGTGPLAIDSNPLAAALRSTLVKVDPEAGRVVLAFEPGALFVQGNGVVQGGIVSAMLDFTMAFALMARLEHTRSCATVNMATNFLRAAPQGRYRAQGEVERCGRTLGFTTARLFNEHTGALVASASSALAIAPEHGGREAGHP